MNSQTNCRAAFAALLLCSSVAQAQIGYTPVYEINGGTMKFNPLAGGGFSRAYSPGAIESMAGRTYTVAGTDIAVVDAVSLAGRAGPLEVAVPATVAAVEALTAIATVMATGPGAAIIGTGVAGIVAMRIYRDGGLHWDQGQPKEVLNAYACGGDHFGMSQESACAAFARYSESTVPQPPVGSLLQGWTLTSCNGGTPGSCYFSVKTTNCYQGDCSNVSYSQRNAQVLRVQTTQCAAVIDALNPAYSVAAGSPPGPDGKCRSARYNHVDMTPAQAAAKVLDNPHPGLVDQLKQGLQDMWNPVPRDASGINSKPEQSVKATPGPANITGPTSQPGQPGTSTSTGPGGTSTTSTTPQYNYSYSPTTITYNETNTTITVNPDGTSTTTTNNPPPTQPQDPKDPCTQHPDSAGCQPLGELDSPDLPDQQVDLSITPDTGWHDANGVCPAPRSMAIHGMSELSFSWQPFCDFASGIRPVVIAVAWLAAAGIFMGFARREA